MVVPLLPDGVREELVREKERKKAEEERRKTEELNRQNLQDQANRALVELVGLRAINQTTEIDRGGSVLLGAAVERLSRCTVLWYMLLFFRPQSRRTKML
jgi:hypothetical protein